MGSNKYRKGKRKIQSRKTNNNTTPSEPRTKISDSQPKTNDLANSLKRIDKYRTGVCSICLMTEYDFEKNPLISCQFCNLYVHENCYGVEDSINNFKCDICASGIAVDSVSNKIINYRSIVNYVLGGVVLLKI